MAFMVANLAKKDSFAFKSMEEHQNALETIIGAKFLHAYLECSDKMQAVVRNSLAILADPETDDDDRQMTLATLAEALFPHPHKGQLGMDLAESEKDTAEQNAELRAIVAEMDHEEHTFADRLAALMKQQGLTQFQLAEKIGVGQPAISNMLNRTCRPQKRTIVRLAEALGVSPKELWPSS